LRERVGRRFKLQMPSLVSPTAELKLQIALADLAAGMFDPWADGFMCEVDAPNVVPFKGLTTSGRATDSSPKPPSPQEGPFPNPLAP